MIAKNIWQRSNIVSPASMLSKLIVVSLLLVAPAIGQAQFEPTYDWKSGAPNTNFLDAGNWAAGLFAPPGDKVPGAGEKGKISNGGVAVIDAASHQISVLEVGPVGVGSLSLVNGAVLDVLSAGGSTFGRLLIGVGGSGNGEVSVNGAGSRLSTGREVIIGSGGMGRLDISDGGAMEVGSDLTISGSSSNQTASVGVLNIGSGLTDAVGGGLIADRVYFGYGSSTVNFNHANINGVVIASDFLMRSTSVGTAEINHVGPGMTRLTGQFDYRGDINIDSGTFVLGGGNVSVEDRANVGDTFVNGTVNVADGALALGISSEGNRGARTLNISGDLLMSIDSRLEMGMGAVSEDAEGVGVGDLIRVDGTLLLDGAITIFDIGGESGGPGFGIGRYELITYGDLHDDSRVGSVLLDLEGGLNGSLSIDNTADGGRIILTLDAGLGSLAYWGLTDGDWNSEGWSATENMAPPLVDWTDGIGAVFRGPDGGEVSITHPDGVLLSSLSFETNDYVIAAADGGGPLRFAPADPEGPSLVRFNVMDGVSSHIAVAAVEDVAGLRFFKDGGGTLVLSNDDNHWTGGTTVNSGRLVIGDGGESGDLPGDVRLFGTLAFNRSDEYVFAGAITDGGTLRQIGSGTLVLTHDNSTSGWRTFIESGAVELRDDGRVGSGTIDIANGASLVLARAGDWTLTNTLTGSGALAQRGGGVLTLAGTLTGFTGALLAEHGRIDLGAGADFRGSVTVDDRLVVNGAVTGAVTVRDGGRLGGTGSVGSLSVGNGGTVSPGNSIGTLTVTGNASFAANSVFEVEANNAGEADRINVGGALNISGGTVQVLASPDQRAAWSPFTEYAILTHGGNRLGEFADVETDLAFLDPRLEYRPGMVVLHLDRSDITFADVAITPNQRQAAAALEALGLTHSVAGEVVPLYDQVVGGTSTDAILAFDAVSGELHASMAGMLLDDSRLVRDALLGRAALTAGRSTATQVWARALTHRGESEGSGVHDFERDAQGLLVGADHVLGDGQYGFGWTAGHHRNGEAEIKSLRSQGEVKSTHVGAYLGTRAEGLGIRGGLAHSWHEVDTERTVAFTGFNEYVTANYKARTTQLFAEVDYEVEVAGQSIAPFLSVAWARLQTNRFMEADFLSPIGSTAGLRAGSQKHNATFATLGARADLELGERLLVDGMLGYRRTLSGDEPSLRMGFVDGAQGFTIHGAPLARDAMVADIGLALRLGQNIRIGAAYNGLLGSDVRDHAVEARLSIALQ